jgi:predicted HTH transcriptional regulator
MTEMKTCSICGKTKPASQFYYRRCKDCVNRLARERKRKKIRTDPDYRERMLARACERYRENEMRKKRKPQPLSRKNKKILAYIQANEPCTIGEIAIAVGVASNAIINRLTVIENNGTLLWQDDHNSIGIFRVIEVEEVFNATC